MIILDTNIFIYLANGNLNRQTIASKNIAHATVTKIEALGFSRIFANEQLLLEALFGESQEIAMDNNITNTAIKLRQAKSMSLGDAIVAATAIETNSTLWTANSADFVHIEDLKIHNPLVE